MPRRGSRSRALVLATGLAGWLIVVAARPALALPPSRAGAPPTPPGGWGPPCAGGPGGLIGCIPSPGEVARLADRLAAGEPLVTALRPLADAINDDVGDLVVGALLLAADPSQKAGGLARQLAELAVRARQKAGYRQRVQTGRARIYASARAIIVITLGMVVALLVFARGFLSPYASPVGQLALLAIGAIFGLGFALLARLGRLRIAERFLAATTQPESGPW